MATKTINISLDEKLLKEIDKAAKAEFSSRSDYIRAAVVKHLQLATPQDAQVIASAQKILQKYQQDFQNLAQR